MHEPVKGRLEEYLRGDGPFPEVEAHLQRCPSCRDEVDAMRVQARQLHTLRAPALMEPGPAFYARLMNRIEEQARPSAWALFGDSIFARRLAYASAAFLLLFGTFLVSSANDPQQAVAAASTPELILAGDTEEIPPPIEVHPAERGAVLVNLASYQQDFQ